MIKEYLEVIMKTVLRIIFHNFTISTTAATTYIKPSQKTQDAIVQSKDQNVVTPGVANLEFTTPKGMKITVQIAHYFVIINATVSFEYGH